MIEYITGTPIFTMVDIECAFHIFLLLGTSAHFLDAWGFDIEEAWSDKNQCIGDAATRAIW